MVETIPALTSADMAAIARLVYERSGIRLGAAKAALVTARLQKRVRLGGFATFGAYVAHVQQPAQGGELDAMVDALTTNKTAFFREPEHFRLLVDEFLPARLAAGATVIRGWSAGCATGEEPYSLAVALLDALRSRVDCSVDLLATDVCSTVLATAKAGVYPAERVRAVPRDILKRHFEQGVGAQDGLVRVLPRLRRLIQFERHNLLEPASVSRPRDFIWCRNTLMYFDRTARQRAVANLEANLAPHGWLFVAHAENLTGVEHGLERVAPAVFRRRHH